MFRGVLVKKGLLKRKQKLGGDGPERKTYKSWAITIKANQQQEDIEKECIKNV